MTKEEIVKWVEDNKILGAVHVSSCAIEEIIDKAYEEGSDEQRGALIEA